MGSKKFKDLQTTSNIDKLLGVAEPLDGVTPGYSLVYSSDDTLAINSDAVVSTQKAVKGYVDAGLANKLNVGSTTADIAASTDRNYVTDNISAGLSASPTPITSENPVASMADIVSSEVTSVNGKTGDVVLTTEDIGTSTDKNYVTDNELAGLGASAYPITSDNPVVDTQTLTETISGSESAVLVWYGTNPYSAFYQLHNMATTTIPTTVVLAGTGHTINNKGSQYTNMKMVQFDGGDDVVKQIEVYDGVTFDGMPSLARGAQLNLSTVTQPLCTNPNNGKQVFIGIGCTIQANSDAVKMLDIDGLTLTIDNKGTIYTPDNTHLITLSNSSHLILNCWNEASLTSSCIWGEANNTVTLKGSSFPIPSSLPNFSGTFNVVYADNTTQIENDSSVPGATLTDALNLLSTSPKGSNKAWVDQALGNDETGAIATMSLPFATFNTAVSQITDATVANPYSVHFSSGVHPSDITLHGNISLVGDSKVSSIIYPSTSNITCDVNTFSNIDSSIVIRDLNFKENATPNTLNLNMSSMGGGSTFVSKFYIQDCILGMRLNWQGRENDAVYLHNCELNSTSGVGALTVEGGKVFLVNCNATTGVSITATTNTINVYIIGGTYGTINVSGAAQTVNLTIYGTPRINNLVLNGAAINAIIDVSSLALITALTTLNGANVAHPRLKLGTECASPPSSDSSYLLPNTAWVQSEISSIQHSEAILNVGSSVYGSTVSDAIDTLATSVVWEGSVPFSTFYTNSDLSEGAYNRTILLSGSGHEIDVLLVEGVPTTYTNIGSLTFDGGHLYKTINIADGVTLDSMPNIKNATTLVSHSTDYICVNPANENLQWHVSDNSHFFCASGCKGIQLDTLSAFYVFLSDALLGDDSGNEVFNLTNSTNNLIIFVTNNYGGAEVRPADIFGVANSSLTISSPINFTPPSESSFINFSGTYLTVLSSSSSNLSNGSSVTGDTVTDALNTLNNDVSGLVPKTTTVNGHALSDNVTITASDIAGISNNYVNPKILSDDIVYPTAADFSDGATHDVANEAELITAISSATAGDVINLTSNITLTATLVIDKKLKIDGNYTIDTAASSDAPVTMITITGNDVYITSSVTIKHLKTTNTSNECVINLNNATGFVCNAQVEFMEFGFILRGSFSIGGKIHYTGVASNSNRAVAIYKITEASQVNGVEWDFVSNATPVSNFVFLSYATSGDSLDYTLNVSNCFQADITKVGRQFCLYEVLTKAVDATPGFIAENNKFNCLNGDIGFLLSSTLDISFFSYIALFNNWSGSAANTAGSYKGLCFCDGSGTLRSLNSTSIYCSGNVNEPLIRSGNDYTSAIGNSVITYKNTAFVNDVPLAKETNIQVENSQYNWVKLIDDKEPAITAGTEYQYLRGDKSWQTLDATAVGLEHVTNDAQTQAAVVPNTAPASGQVLVGGESGAYSPQNISGDATLSSAGALIVSSFNDGTAFGSAAAADSSDFAAVNVWNGSDAFSTLYANKSLDTNTDELTFLLDGEGHTIDALSSEESSYDPNVVNDPTSLFYAPYATDVNAMIPDSLSPTVNTTSGICDWLEFNTLWIAGGEGISYTIPSTTQTALTIRFKYKTEAEMISMGDPDGGMGDEYAFNGTALSLSDGAGFNLSLTGYISDTMMLPVEIRLVLDINNEVYDFLIQDMYLEEYEIDINESGWILYKDGNQQYSYTGAVNLPTSDLVLSSNTTTGSQFIGFLTIFNEVKHSGYSYGVTVPPYSYVIPYPGMQNITFNGGSSTKTITVANTALLGAIPNLLKNVSLESASNSYICTNPQYSCVIGDNCEFICSGAGNKGIELSSGEFIITNSGKIGNESGFPCITFTGSDAILSVHVNNDSGTSLLEPAGIFSNDSGYGTINIYGNASYSMPAAVDFTNFSGTFTPSFIDKSSSIENDSDVSGDTVKDALNTLKSSIRADYEEVTTANVTLTATSAKTVVVTLGTPSYISVTMPDATTIHPGWNVLVIGNTFDTNTSFYKNDGVTVIGSSMVPYNGRMLTLIGSSDTNGTWHAASDISGS